MRKLIITIIILLIPMTAFCIGGYARPDADVSTGWTPSTGTDNYAMVDEGCADTGDEDTTYNSDTDTEVTDRFEVPAIDIPSDATITSVFVKAVAKNTSPGCDPSGCPKLRVNAYHDSTYNGTYLQVSPLSGSGGAYEPYTHEFISSESWQPEDFDGTADAVDIGYERDAGRGALRVTCIELEVNWETPAGTGSTTNTGLYDATVYDATIYN